jgi:hypothetical protein
MIFEDVVFGTIIGILSLDAGERTLLLSCGGGEVELGGICSASRILDVDSGLICAPGADDMSFVGTLGGGAVVAFELESILFDVVFR